MISRTCAGYVKELEHPEKRVVLLDECTSNLDAETETTIMRNIWPLLNDKTVVIITHRISSIESLVDKIIAIDRGRVVSRQEEQRTLGDLGLILSS